MENDFTDMLWSYWDYSSGIVRGDYPEFVDSRKKMENGGDSLWV